MRRYRRNLRDIARTLRGRCTDAEYCLWQHLRKKQLLGVQFYRQRPIGECIVDFYAPKVALIIEVDGGQHYETDMAKLDEVRTQFLQSTGLSVLRFDNRQVLTETDAVIASIYCKIASVLKMKLRDN